MSATASSSPASRGTVAFYDDKYFSWHAPLGEFGGWANLIKFRDYIKPEDVVIDYGCGGGYLLKQINCGERVGIEVNDTARKTADSIGIRTVASAAELPNNLADVIISNNALEHTARPLNELKDLFPKLKPGGRIVFVVPNESIIWKYAPNDVNQHLYAWSPMSIGNLFNHAGFEVEWSKTFIHKWPRHYRFWARLGPTIFHVVCRISSRWERSWFQIRVVARRPVGSTAD